MRSLIFAKRNLKEYVRSPIMLFFTIIFPILMFFVFILIKVGTNATDDMVPMFKASNLVVSISVFSFSFTALNLSTQIAKDRELSFQTRLKLSPMTGVDFFLGYFILSFLISVIQCVLTVIVGLIFKVEFNKYLLLTILSLLIISVFYISAGILIGSIFTEKSCGGISSILIQATALFSGMFFPLTDGTFKTVLSLLPFLPSVNIPQNILNGSFNDFTFNLIVLAVYTIILVTTSIFIFTKKLSDK